VSGLEVGRLASAAQCAQALDTVVDLLNGLEDEVRAKYVLERTVSVRVADLDCTWAGRTCLDGLVDLHLVESEDEARAQVRLTVGSDDLLALVEGRLAVPMAVATGRLRVQANPLDLLRLGAFL
jgi:hypothetical protein